MQDPKAFHEALAAHSPSYREYAAAKLRGWKDTNAGDRADAASYVRPKVVLGAARDYAAHYDAHLVPLLCEPAVHVQREFLDFGSAPGGLCHCLLAQALPSQGDGGGAGESPSTRRHAWRGTAVTLSPADGGLAIDEHVLAAAAGTSGPDAAAGATAATATATAGENDSSARLRVKYHDVCDAEGFVAACTDGGAREHYADFVNCGIVLDARVKAKKSGRVIGFGEQLHIQLTAALRCLRADGRGDLMLALRFDFPSLPECVPTLDLFRRHAAQLFVLPTLYTRSAGRKQFYLLCRGVRMTRELCDAARGIWDAGRDRYKCFVRATLAGRAAAAAGPQRRERRDGDGDDGDGSATGEEAPAAAAAGPDLAAADLAAADRARVVALVRDVYGAVGPSLDVFCDMIRQHLVENGDDA